MKNAIIRRAVKIAIDKMGQHPEYKNYMHYSFVVQRNQIVEWATNNRKTPPIHYGYHRMSKSHSEIEAYRRARGLLDSHAFEMVNIRLNRHGQLRISKPCPCCYHLLSSLGCSRFYYSSDVGFLMIRGGE